MASLKEIQQKLLVLKYQKITRAMQMVAASKIRDAKNVCNWVVLMLIACVEWFLI